jgi:thiamine-phosphate pyrophosphorylase
MTLSQRCAQLERARFYAILDTGYVAPDHLYAVATQIVRGGVDLLQFRAKGMGREEIVRMGQGLREIIPAIDAPTPGPLFILNDHPGLVEEIGADGVHVGQDDLSVETAREQAGPEVLIGKSTHSLAQAIAAEKENPDYIGVGPLFATPTKPDYAPVGLDLIGQVAAKVRVPQFCIGGVNERTLPAVLAAGARRVVIVSDLLKSGDIPRYCRRIRAMLQRGAK